MAAATPSHLLARWAEGETRINTELLEAGAVHSDDDYRARHRIRDPDFSHPVFLRDLDAKEVAARIHNNLGVLHVRAGLLQAAAVDYARAIEIDPRLPAPHYNEGVDQLSAAHPEKALAEFDAALEIYPADVWALNNRGLARLRMGERNEAMEDFRLALTIDFDFPAAKKNLELLGSGHAPPPTRPAAERAEIPQTGTASGEAAQPRP